jgi:glycosyltransferase involved in cell wall biosynthesis
LARGLVARGNAVEVITTDPTGCLPPVEERSGVLVRRFLTVGHNGVYFIAPRLGWWLLRNARRFALIHAQSYHTPVALAAAVASRRSRIPLLVSPYYHGSGHSPFRRLLHRPYRPLGGWMLRQADRVLCISFAEELLLQQDFGPHLSTSVVPCGVAREEDAGFARWRAPPAGPIVILAVGRLDAYKQTARLVATMAHLPPAYELVLVGDGPCRTAIARLGTELGLSARVHLLGHVPEPDLRGWYRTARVFATLSRYESFGLTLLEAAVAGSAIVASDIPAHREVAGYLGFGQVQLVAVDSSPADVARSIMEMASRGRGPYLDRRALPTWDAFVEGVLTAYRAATHVDLPALGELPA